MRTPMFALLGVFLCAPAFAQDIVITTGGRGGSYFATGEKLAEVLKEYDYSAEAVKSDGSVENIERVASGEAALGFTQLDALAWWIGRNEEQAGKVKLLGDLFPECVYVAVNAKAWLRFCRELGIYASAGARFCRKCHLLSRWAASAQ